MSEIATVSGLALITEKNKGGRMRHTVGKITRPQKEKESSKGVFEDLEDKLAKPWGSAEMKNEPPAS